MSVSRQLSEYREFLDALEKTLIAKSEFHCTPPLSEIMQEPRLLVTLNHSTPLSWIPAILTLALKSIGAGGGDRTPRGVVDKWFYSNPLTKPLAEYLSQSYQPQSFEDLLSSFSQAQRTDLVIFPEGANSFFGNVADIQEFRSYRFVELAIRAGSPILLAVHKGSEGWSFPLQLPASWGPFVLPFSKFFGEMILKSSTFNLPLLPHKLEHFQMSCELYRPQLQLSELSEDRSQAQEQLKVEAEKIRQRMQDLLAALSEK